MLTLKKNSFLVLDDFGVSRKVALPTNALQAMTSHVQFTASKRSISDLTPKQHYSMRIQQFSLLAESQEKYESSAFEIGGYKWFVFVVSLFIVTFTWSRINRTSCIEKFRRLRLYPRGNSKSYEFEKEHPISLYLAIEKRDSFPQLWEVFVQMKFFAFDHIHNKYAMYEDELVRRYHEKKTEYGIQFYINDRNGYLVDDTCVIGAEVFVFTPSTIHESIYSVMPRNGSMEWKLRIYPTMKCKPIFTEEFISGYKWRLTVDSEDCGQNEMSLSLCLQLTGGHDLGPKDRVFANYKLRVRHGYSKNYKVSKSFTTDEKLNNEKPRADACYVCERSSYGYDLTVEVEILSISVSKLVS